MKKALPLAAVLLALLVLASCAPGINELTNVPSSTGVVANFWRGLWNGIIAPVTLVISFFDRNVQMYDPHNNGVGYNIGFFLGIAALFSGGAGGARTRRRRD